MVGCKGELAGGQKGKRRGKVEKRNGRKGGGEKGGKLRIKGMRSDA